MRKTQMRFTEKQPGTTNRFGMDFSTLYISSLAKDWSFPKLIVNFPELSYHNKRDIPVSSKATKSFWLFSKNLITFFW